MALNVKQKYPGTQGGAAQLYASDTRLSLRRREQVFTRLSKSYKENIFQAPEAPAMKKLLFCWMRKDAGSVDATWRISSPSLRMCARQDCFVFERPQVVFYCNFSMLQTREQKRQSHWSDSFWPGASTKKTNPRRFKKMTLLRVAFFVSVCTLTLAPFV